MVGKRSVGQKALLGVKRFGSKKFMDRAEEVRVQRPNWGTIMPLAYLKTRSITAWDKPCSSWYRAKNFELCSNRVKDAESGITAELYKFQQSGSLITAIHQFDRSTLLFGSFPSGLHVMDLRQRYAVYEGELPKAPSAGQATPLCVRHSQINDNTFIVCGRFPSVLMYDIRGGLRPSFSIYSGANSLSSMIAGSGDVVVAGGSYRGMLYLVSLLINQQVEARLNVLTFDLRN